MLQDTTYRDQSKIFLEKAFRELEEGDLLQASEKGWGAAAQMVKAVAQERGWEHDSHRRLFNVLGRLALEAGDQELRHGFNAQMSCTPTSMRVGSTGFPLRLTSMM